MLGSWSYSYVSAFSSLSAIDHHKSFVNKQDSGSSTSKHTTNDDGGGGKVNGGRPESSSYDKTLGRLYDSSNSGDGSSSTSIGSGSGAKSSHDSNNQDNGVGNNHRGKNDVSNMNPGNYLPATTGDSLNVPPIDTTTRPSPPQSSSPISTACEQRSDCTSQQGSSNSNHSTSTSTTTTTQEDTPFVLSLPFP